MQLKEKKKYYIKAGKIYVKKYGKNDFNLKAKKKLYPSFLTIVPVRTGSLSFEELERLIT